MNRAHRVNRRGFSRVDLVVVIALGCILLVLLLPCLAALRTRASPVNCVNNLKQVATSFRMWAMDYGGTNELYPMMVSTNDGGAMELVQRGEVFRAFQVMSNELNVPKVLICPADTRSRATSFATLRNANVSYFVSLDAEPANPSMILAGDRNLETNGRALPAGLFLLTTNTTLGWTKDLHNRWGNVAFADGSAQPLNNARLAEWVRTSGTDTNRLAIP